MARKCEQARHSYEQQDPKIHVLSHSAANNISSPSSLGMEPVSWFPSVQKNGKEMWAIVPLIRTTRPTTPRTERQCSQKCQASEFSRNGTRELIFICSNRMARKCEQAWHSYEQEDKPIHVQRKRAINDVSSPSSLGMEPVSRLSAVQIEWQGNVSKRDIPMKKVKTNPRTEPQRNHRRQFSEFARDGTRELIIICSNRMARKCEQAWHLYEQEDPPIHVQSHSVVSAVGCPSLLGMEPVSWLLSDATEWQGDVSKLDIHKKTTNQSTYWASTSLTTGVLRVRSEWNPWVDLHLLK
jgi:hypothetical protein